MKKTKIDLIIHRPTAEAYATVAAYLEQIYGTTWEERPYKPQQIANELINYIINYNATTVTPKQAIKVKLYHNDRIDTTGTNGKVKRLTFSLPAPLTIDERDRIKNLKAYAIIAADNDVPRRYNIHNSHYTIDIDKE